MTRRSQRATCWIIAALAASLALPGLAQAQATKPSVSTGAAANLTPATATLLGRVTPNGAQTTFVFQYGLTKLYTAATPVTAAGAGGAAISVTGDLAGLAPATTYHYRLVAINRVGTRNGADRTFKTQPQPLGLTLAATRGSSSAPLTRGQSLLVTVSSSSAKRSRAAARRVGTCSLGISPAGGS